MNLSSESLLSGGSLSSGSSSDRGSLLSGSLSSGGSLFSGDKSSDRSLHEFSDNKSPARNRHSYNYHPQTVDFYMQRDRRFRLPPKMEPEWRNNAYVYPEGVNSSFLDFYQKRQVLNELFSARHYRTLLPASSSSNIEHSGITCLSILAEHA